MLIGEKSAGKMGFLNARSSGGCGGFVTTHGASAPPALLIV